MKNARISLLVLSIFAFANIECKKDKPQQKQNVKKAAPVRKAPVKKQAVQVVEQETHKIEVDERPLAKNEVVQASEDTKFTENEDGGVVETKVTVVPMPEEGKVVTTTETWTWYDAAVVAAKVAAGAALIGGAGYLAYQNNENFRNGVDASGNYLATSASSGYKNLSESMSSTWNSLTNSDVVKSIQQKIDQLRGSVTPQLTTDIVNDAAAVDPDGIKNLAETIAQASSNPDATATADSIVTKIEDAVENGEQPQLNTEESNFIRSGIAALGLGTAAVLGAKVPAVRNAMSRMNPGNVASEGVTAGLSKFSGSVETVARPTTAQYSSGLFKTPSYANESSLAQQLARDTAARIGAQNEINAQQALAQRYQQSVTRDLNRQQASTQMAKQTAMAQQVGLSAANLGVAGGIAAGANAAANADMNVPSMNLDYALQYNS